jgi:hypothetical protein
MKRKKLYALLLIIVILSMLIYLFIAGSKAFSPIKEIKYPDGCIEVYVENNLTTEPCIEGRLLKKNRTITFDVEGIEYEYRSNAK